MIKPSNPLEFGGAEGGQVGYDEARYIFIPAPLERTVSYGGGTARGPEALLAASEQFELFDGQQLHRIGGDLASVDRCAIGRHGPGCVLVVGCIHNRPRDYGGLSGIASGLDLPSSRRLGRRFQAARPYRQGRHGHSRGS